MPGWLEVESQVHWPGHRLGLGIGALFLLVGSAFFIMNELIVPPGCLLWMGRVLTTSFVLLGALVCMQLGAIMAAPTVVRHAAPDVLPTIPTDPVLLEGSIVSGRVAHELVDEVDHWEFRASLPRWRTKQLLFLGFGILFLMFAGGLLSWVIHTQLGVADWPVSIVLATIATLAAGGSALVVIGFNLRSNYRRLCSLIIPHNGDELELESPQEPKTEDLTTFFQWLFLGYTSRKRQAIPRNQLIAVQLCPWNVVVGAGEGKPCSRAVQGLLVLANSQDGSHQRLPILLTVDYIGAAKLMEHLATTLGVPFLFSADAHGWQIEEARAKDRPPLQIGGY